MLADTIIADRELARMYGPDFVACQRAIARATKFVLAPDFAVAADGLVENYPELEKIVPFCRLPYQTTWIEFAQADRAHWCDAPLHHPEFQSRPSRVGFLMEATSDNLAAWRTMLFWSLRTTPHECSTLNNASLISVDYRTDQPFDEIANLVQIDMAKFAYFLLKDLDKQTLRKLGELSRSDWAGEIRYVIAMLGLLNARNVAERAPVDLTKLNRARRKSGKLPLFEHETLKIRALHRPSLVPSGSSRERAAELRAHFVRGHFKTRQSGVFWWGPHVRGRIGRGEITKDYEVAT
jgi:hypothetical protein